MAGRGQSQHVPSPGRIGGYHPVASPGSSPLGFLEFALIGLEADRPLTWQAGEREGVAYLIGGACEVTVSGRGGALEGVLDSRPSVFDGPPCAVFVPAGSRLGLLGPKSGARLALCSVPPSEDRPPRLIQPRDVSTRDIGRDAWSRRVTSVVDQRAASRLLLGETHNPPGHWSSYPPHKHDADGPGEVPMEEIYHFFVEPRTGFGLQMVYTPADAPEPFERIYPVRDGDTVVIPRGYHPVVAAGGYRLAYLWAISGERVEYGAWANDPNHEWMLR